MKILNQFIPVALLLIATGCQSDEPHTSSRTSTTTRASLAATPQQNAPPAVAEQQPKPTSIQQITTDKATYTVETIPNSRLTATSREGDGTSHIYSSNIIAVYVHTNSNVTVNSTNVTAVPTPANNPQPENK